MKEMPSKLGLAIGVDVLDGQDMREREREREENRKRTRYGRRTGCEKRVTGQICTSVRCEKRVR